MRILMLGNSFTFFHDMPDMVREITGAHVESHTRGGAHLSEQLNAETEMGAATLKSLEEHWDYVVLQEYSNGPITGREAFLRSVRGLCEKIRACGGVPVLYATWAYEKGGPKLQAMGCTYEEMAAGLREAYHAAAEENGPRPYSDMPAMVIKYVLEGAGGASYMELLKGEILFPLGMGETFCFVPSELRPRCVSTDREHRIEQGRYILRDGVAPGTPHDPKARILSLEGEDCPGHAGLFSTAGDMIRLCQGVLAGKVVSAASLRMMAENHVGRPLPGGGFSQCLGCLCYVRHPDQHFSETPVFMSDTALGLSGFAGNHLALDPERGVFEFYLGSRVLNRLSVLVPKPGETIRDYGLNGDGTGAVLWPDGEKVLSSVQYVYLKDEHLHPVTEKLLENMRRPV